MDGELQNPTLRTSDPAVLRALAHPLRVEILAIIDELGECTATQIAEALGESPSNCSFHLRSLAKAGFIERAEARGTSRPWRSVHSGRELRPDPDDIESMRTSASVGALYVQREASRMVEFLTSHGLQETEWLDGITVTVSTIWATSDELAELAREVAALTRRFEGRIDPEQRPAGSRRAHFFGTVNPDLDTPATPDAGSQP